MKKVIVLAVLFTLTLFSCSKDDEHIKEVSIVGKWRSISATLNGAPLDVTFCVNQLNVEFLPSNECVIEGGSIIAGGCFLVKEYGIYTFKDNIDESRSRITDLTEKSFKLTKYYTARQGGSMYIIPDKSQTTFTLERVK